MRATYRLQFTPTFSFSDAGKLVGYLQELGISHLYSSPILKARLGSQHGYDIVDPTRINPQLGSPEEFEALIRTLRRHKMGLLLDIVPNHLAASHESSLWWNLLEYGRSGTAHPVFDIDWNPPNPELTNKILLPFLGKPPDAALEDRDLKLAFREGVFLFTYFDSREFPLYPASYALLLEGAPGLGKLAARFKELPPHSAQDPQIQPRSESLKQELARMCRDKAAVRSFVAERLSELNGERNAASHRIRRLQDIHDAQVYRLAYWMDGLQELNYRRFFNINDLVGVRVEDHQVVEKTHALIFKLLEERKVTGLRIDHIDGLWDPAQYLSDLRERYPAIDLLVEKILLENEQLPSGWPVAGTTGYEFLNDLNRVFISARGLDRLKHVYKETVDNDAEFEEIAYDKKRSIIKRHFPAELRSLALRLKRFSDEQPLDLTEKNLASVLLEVTASLPVYRTYVRGPELTPQDRHYIQLALDRAADFRPQLDPAALDFLSRVLLLNFFEGMTQEQRDAWVYAVMKWQQFSGPVAAKGVEDTALYVYNPLLSLNEVGGDPDLEISIAAFHRHNSIRRLFWPFTLTTTSTHDTKRSEDVRARINVLADIADEWSSEVAIWMELNRPYKKESQGKTIPGPNAEILLYETLLGAWPLMEGEMEEFKTRLKEFLIKAAREAKVHTNWFQPDEMYEQALTTFAEAILAVSSSSAFFERFNKLQSKTAFFGMLNSLSQVLLKIASPGTPDFYQGTELWDLSLVDPDNRRPVDFDLRSRRLAELKDQEQRDPGCLLTGLLAGWRDGRIKLYTILRALRVRQRWEAVFHLGDYCPLRVAGEHARSLCSFSRRREGVWIVAVAPCHVVRLVECGEFPLGRPVWKKTRVIVPSGGPVVWKDAFTDEEISTREVEGRNVLYAGDVLTRFPTALLVGKV